PDDKKRMLYVLAQVYDRELGDVAKAIETYQTILDIDADELPAIQSLDRLLGQAERWPALLGNLARPVELSETTAEPVGLRDAHRGAQRAEQRQRARRVRRVRARAARRLGERAHARPHRAARRDHRYVGVARATLRLRGLEVARRAAPGRSVLAPRTRVGAGG